MSLIDQIDQSLEKATNLQQQRFQQEENRQKSLTSEISYLRQQLHNEDDAQLDMSSYSPLRDDIKQLELQNEILSDKKSEQHQYQYSDTDPDEDLIEPIYQANRLNKIQSKSPLIKPKQIHHKKHQEKQPNKTIQPKKQINIKKQQIQQQEKQSTHQQGKIIKHRKVKTLQIHEQILDNSNEKENYVIQEDKYQNYQLQQKIYQIKQQVQNQLTTKTVVNKSISNHLPESEQKEYQIRGLRDQAELKYFGRVLPCNECVYLLNKGMSSDYCSQHGKINKEKPRNKAIPSRFGKYY